MLRRIVRWISTSRLGRREPAASAWRAIVWWEVRRIPFNLIVGATGVLTGFAMTALLFTFVALFRIPWDLPDPPIFVVFGVLLYGIMANLCYTLGWMTELGVRLLRPTQSDAFASLAFALGVAFSVVVTLLPLVPWLAILFFAAAQGPR